MQLNTRTANIESLPPATTIDVNAAGKKPVLFGKPSQGTLKVIDRSVSFENRYCVVIQMEEFQSIVFQGIVDVCVISGAVSLYGYTATEKDQWLRVYSPSSHPLVQIQAIPSDNKPPTSEDTDQEDIRQISKIMATRMAANSVVVGLRSVSCGLEDIGRVAPPYGGLFSHKSLSERLDIKLSRGAVKRRLVQRTSGSNATSIAASMDVNQEMVAEYQRQEELLLDAIGLPNFYPLSYMTPDLHLLQTPRDWSETLELASTAISPVYVVAGDQGQGKSTFTRMLANRLVERHGRVAFMETDLGQSEIAPGSVSLSVVSKPLLGPPFTHVGRVEPYHAVYMGVVSPKSGPDQYIAGIQRLIAVYRRHVQDSLGQGQTLPVLVNTQGWLKGLGLDLHYSLCQTVCPTDYIQIYDPSPSGAAADGMSPIIDFSSIDGCDPRVSWITSMTYDRAIQTLHAKHSYGCNTKMVPKMAAQDMRALAMISSFHLSNASLTGPQTWDMHSPLASLRPWVVALRDLVVWVGEEDIPPSQLLRVLNGSAVGVIATARAPTPRGFTWTEEQRAALCDPENTGMGISDQAAMDLSEPGSRALLRSRLKHVDCSQQLPQLPQLVYGQPKSSITTFVAHAIVRSIDSAKGTAHLLLPRPSADSIASQRLVGLVKGPGPSHQGIEVPVWLLADGGYAERAMGQSSAQRPGRFSNRRRSTEAARIGIQEAPYLSVEADQGVGASTARSKGGLMRRGLEMQ